MLTVCCVCVPGGCYTSMHTTRLYDQVREHLTQPFDFFIITGSDKPGFWAKVDLFKPDLLDGRVLYLDLDVTVVGNLDDLANFPAPFVAIKDYANPVCMNSSVMAWDAGAADPIYENFTPDVMKRMHGDQNWITANIAPVTFPKAWCPSYKAHVLPAGRVPDDARVIVYHGQPRPWDLPANHLEALRAA